MANREIPFEDGMKIGLGYNRLTGDVLPSTAVSGTAVSAFQPAEGQQVSMDCVTVQDVETLHKSLGVSVDAAGSYMGFSGSAKVDYVNSCDFSSFSTYVLVRVSVQNAFQSLDNPVFAEDASQLLVVNDPIRFRLRFGDSFIAGVKTGGEYFAIYQITGSDSIERENLSVSVHAAYNSLVLAASLSTTIQTATSNSKSHLDVRVHVFRQGSVSEADVTLEDIMKTARAFPVSVSGDKAFPYAVLLQDYSALRQPNDAFTYIQIENQQQVLGDLAAKRFEFLTLKNDFSYVIKHAEDFQNADGSTADRSALMAQQVKINAAISTMEQEADQCSRDATQCTFANFESGMFPLPTLKPGPVEVRLVPNVVGMSLAQVLSTIKLVGITSIGDISEDWAHYLDMLTNGFVGQDGRVQYSAHSPNDIVILAQSPEPGTPVTPGMGLGLQVDLRPGVPDIV